MDKKYIQDASKLIKHAKSKRYPLVIERTSEVLNDVATNILPSFTQIQDGFYNLISGLGGKQAKSTYTTYRTNFCFTDRLLYSLYETYGLSRKIVSVVSNDATKNNITINNDNDNDLKNKWGKLKANKIINQADKYRRHFGGAIIYMDIDDGLPLWEPVNINNIKSVRKLRVYSRTDVYFTNVNFIEDINSEIYGQPEYYTVVPKYTTPFNVHHSRVIEFKGTPVPTQLDYGYRYYWGQSVLEPLWDTLKKVGASIENLDQLLYEMTISIYKIKGLADLICGKKWNEIKNIIDTTNESKSTLRAMLIDADGHEYSRDSLSFPGVKEVVELLFTLLSGESFIPISRLFGKQLGGLNNEGGLELSTYYDEIKAHQENELTEQAQTIVDMINISKEIGNKKVKDATVQYNNPTQLSEKEELDNKKLQSEIDNTYVSMGAVSNAEIRELRFENDYTYNMNVSELDSYEENIFEEEDNEPEEEENNSPEQE